MAQDYYELLGVSRNATKDELEKAHRQLARKYHPDLNPDDKVAQQKFKDIQHAYDVLSDPEKRQMYDQLGPDYERMGQGAQAAGGYPRGAGGRGGQGYGFEEMFGGGGGGQFEGDLGDFFRQFTGGGGASGRRAPAKGADLTAELTVPFNTAVLGGQASISVRRANKSESITVKIPPGVETGKKMRLRSQGEPGRGGDAGDLIVTLTVAKHPFFKRNGKDLELKLPVTVAEATLGATVDIPTPGGKVALKIPPGTSSDRRLRIKGQGVLSQSGAPGDLYVLIAIMVPEQLQHGDVDDETKAAVQRIETLYGNKDVRQGIVW